MSNLVQSPLSHLDDQGRARMVDVSAKPDTMRIAEATAKIIMQAETLDLITTGQAAKGDVLAAARIAGIMAAKKTSDLIPLCHPLLLSKVEVTFTPAPPDTISIAARVSVKGPTGVEMEALTACAVAALTIYDMLKAVDRAMVITDIQLVHKSGGKSSDFNRAAP
jgi:cyclic pyranopterin phosphate synthase